MVVEGLRAGISWEAQTRMTTLPPPYRHPRHRRVAACFSYEIAPFRHPRHPRHPISQEFFFLHGKSYVMVVVIPSRATRVYAREAL